MRVLGIETSCDETGVAVYDTDARPARARAALAGRDARRPTAASCRSSPRATTSGACVPLTRAGAGASRARARRTSTASPIREGPGSPARCWSARASRTALGLRAAASRSIGVHHLEGPPAVAAARRPAPEFPFVALLVSGGHSQLLRRRRRRAIPRCSATRRTTRPARRSTRPRSCSACLSRRPGARATRRAGRAGRASSCRGRCWHSGDLDFSFSRAQDRGADAVRRERRESARRQRAPTSRASSRRVVDVLAAKSLRALDATGLRAAGGRGRRRREPQLRARLVEGCAPARGPKCSFPDLELCTDNGAMIALAGALRLQRGAGDDASDFSVRPRWP